MFQVAEVSPKSTAALAGVRHFAEYNLKRRAFSFKLETATTSSTSTT
jgi:hypothetical protein